LFNEKISWNLFWVFVYKIFLFQFSEWTHTLFNWKALKFKESVRIIFPLYLKYFWFYIVITLFISILFRDLHFNLLSGPIPYSIGNLSNLKNLYDNKWCMIDLKFFVNKCGNFFFNRELHQNSLNGSIPSSIGNLENLENLYEYHFV